MGKKAQIKRQKLENLREERNKLLEDNIKSKNPWMFFWKRIDFWIVLVSLICIMAYPFLRSFGYLGGSKGDRAILHTSKGDIEIELFQKDAPKTVENFKKLANQNFYKELLWHRVIDGFMIQTGDPSGDGTGGPGYQFEDEINSHKVTKGSVAMANSGPNTNGSQFFIVTEKDQPHLDGQHTVFGQVTKGLEVAQAISKVETDENDRPVDQIYLKSVEIK